MVLESTYIYDYCGLMGIIVIVLESLCCYFRGASPLLDALVPATDEEG